MSEDEVDVGVDSDRTGVHALMANSCDPSSLRKAEVLTERCMVMKLMIWEVAGKRVLLR